MPGTPIDRADTMPPPIALIMNASAGSGCSHAWADELTAKFSAAGIDVKPTLAQSGAEMIEVAQAAVAAAAPLVIAGGGDGTMNAVASVLTGTDTAFGVLPLGTLNHFAKDLGIPLQLDAAIRTIAEGQRVRIDVGEVNGRIFLNNSSLGLYPDIVRDRTKQQRRIGRGKWLAFLWATVTALRRYPFLKVRLGLNGETLRRLSPFIFIGNNEYTMEGFNIGERARLDGGQLSLYLSHRTGRLGLLNLALHSLFKRLQQAKDFEAVLATEILVETHRKRMRVATDGEVTVMNTPLTYRIRPGALHVIVPRALP